MYINRIIYINIYTLSVEENFKQISEGRLMRDCGRTLHRGEYRLWA